MIAGCLVTLISVSILARRNTASGSAVLTSRGKEHAEI
jgi:hypothetical protein